MYFEIGQIIGGTLVAAFFTTIISLFVRHFVAPRPRLAIANLLSLIAMTMLGAYGAARGGTPDLLKAFGAYLPGQILVALIDLLRTRGAEARKAADAARYRNRVEPAISEPQPDIPGTGAPTTLPKETAQEEGLNAPPPRPPTFAAVTPPPPPPPPFLGEATRAKTQSWNLVARHWRGELSLGWSYWGIAFLGNLLSVMVVLVFAKIFTTERGYDPANLFCLFVLQWFAIVAIVVWQVGGTWKSATRHAERRSKLGQGTGWATAAKFMLVLGVLRFIGDFGQTSAPQMSELYDMAWRGDPSLPAYSMRVMRDGTELEITGGIKYGLVDDFRRVISASPRIRVVHLDSIGGRIGEAEKLRKEISRRGLITYVAGRCASACTLVYAGGRERWILSSSKLGYHSPSFPGMTSGDKASMVNEWEVAFKEAGISHDIIAKGLSVPSNDMWYPTIQELLAARVVTNVSNGNDFAMSGFGANPSANDLMAGAKAGMPALSAMQKELPNDYDRISQIIVGDFNSGATLAKFTADVRAQLIPILNFHRPRADGDVLLDYARLEVEQYQALARSNPTLCYQYAAFGGAGVNLTGQLPPALVQRELALQERVILTSTTRSPVSEAVINAILARLQQTLVDRYGEERMAVFQLDKVPPEKYADYCALSTTLYQEVLRLRPTEAVAVLRYLQTTP